MGDVIHNLPMVTDVAEHILGAQIDWVVEEAFADKGAPLSVPDVMAALTRMQAYPA
jgi:ADP-heptose:LPS heptosyltransferase